MTNFIPKLLATKKVTKGGCFWYLWTAKDQNIYSKVHFQSLLAILKDSNRLYQAGVKLAPARVTTSSQSSCGKGLKTKSIIDVILFQFLSPSQLCQSRSKVRVFGGFVVDVGETSISDARRKEIKLHRCGYKLQSSQLRLETKN